MRIVSLVLAGCLASMPFGVAFADDGPDYGAFGVGTYLSYTDNLTAGGPIDRVPHLTIAFGDGPQHTAQMDTGSTGLVVSADQVPSLDGEACTGCITYSSSGRILTGVWVKTPVTISGGNQASVTTMPIQVLAVTSIDCTDHARDCTREDNPKGVDLIGVGFDREHDHMAQSTPQKNPFLNIASTSDAPSRRGYVVTRLGVHVGLTRKNTQGDFHFVKLAPDPKIDGEWKATPACIVVASSAPACGSVLVDTGVTSMFLTVPAAAVDGVTDGDALKTDTRLAFTFPDSQGTIAAIYGIVVGGTDPLTPQTINLNTTRPCPFVNTSVRLLNGFDILYDADGGFFAFRPRS